MLINASYTTKEKDWDFLLKTFIRRNKKAQLEAVAIMRQPVGPKARNRYFYFALAAAPDDASFTETHFGVKCIRVNVFRKINPQFNPKKLTFEGNICKLSSAEEKLNYGQD